MRNELGPFALAVDLAYKFGTMYLKMYHWAMPYPKRTPRLRFFYQLNLAAVNRKTSWTRYFS